MGKKHGKKASKRDRKAARRAGRAGGVLHGPAEIRRYFRTSETPIWFVSPTAFPLLGVDRWVRGLEYVTCHDSFGGRHPRVFVPRHVSGRSFGSVADACTRLLADAEVVDRLGARGGGIVLVAALDEETERLVAAPGLEVAAPPAELRRRLASPTVAAQLAAEAGVRPLPTVVGRASGYGVLHALSVSAGLGRDLVVQTSDGETFLVGSEPDWDLHAGALTGRELTLTTRSERRSAVVAGVVTRHGTLAAQSPAELIRLPGLTPHGEARCATDASASRLPEEQRAEARRCTQLVGDRLREEGYRGWFELELVLERETGAVYFGALGPGISDRGTVATVAAVASGEAPLLLFHLLEHMGVEYEIDADALNAPAAGPTDAWSVLYLEDGAEDDEPFARSPRTGVWRIDPTASAGIRFVRRETDWRGVGSSDEAFYLRIAHADAERRRGGDIGILVARGSLESDGRPTERALAWGAGIARRLETAPLAGVPKREPVPLRTA